MNRLNGIGLGTRFAKSGIQPAEAGTPNKNGVGYGPRSSEDLTSLVSFSTLRALDEDSGL